ncbi:CRISPR-associated protein, Csm5 family [Streptococcus cristatus]|uniref:CRISPR system Cms protein Csm5 n=1 Tax=Streptococcus cristatus TaxID=45634 RepID=A0A139MZE8_STRCR|nr:CRISPR-associated protein, Csm5 family [Streptococcus cristatus]
MKTRYRKFKLVLWTLGPVHIGSGELRTAREYILEGDEYYFPDMTLLYNELIERGIAEKFQEFLVDPNNKTNRISDFLAMHGLANHDFGGYRLKATGLEKPKGKHATRNQETTDPGEINGVHQFMRDSYGRPYVPGSSLKGAIRTILMNTHWHSEDFKKKDKKEKSLKIKM